MIRGSTARRRRRQGPAQTESRLIPVSKGATGPRTAAGKAISCRNAIRHGLLAHTTLVEAKGSDLPLVDRGEFVRILRGYLRRYQPEGPAELNQIEIAVSALWRYRRALELELGQMSHADMGTRNDLTVMAKQLEEMLKAMEWDDLLDDEPNRVVLWMEGTLITEEEDGSVIPPPDWKPKQESESAEERDRRRQQEENERYAREMEEWKKRRAARAVSLDTLRKLAKILEQASPRSFLGDELERLERYESHLLKTYYRAMAVLERLQRLRRGDSVPPPFVGYVH